MAREIRFYNAREDVFPYVNGDKYGFSDLIIGFVDKVADATVEDIEKAIDQLEPATVLNFMGMMPVFTNETGMYGAINIISSKEKLETMFPDGYVVIPSSIHEVIVLPKEAVDLEGMNDLIQSINIGVVSEAEVLSDHYYEF